MGKGKGGVQSLLTPRYFAARDLFVGAGGCWNIPGVPGTTEGIVIGAATDIYNIYSRASGSWSGMLCPTTILALVLLLWLYIGSFGRYSLCHCSYSYHTPTKVPVFQGIGVQST